MKNKFLVLICSFLLISCSDKNNSYLNNDSNNQMENIFLTNNHDLYEQKRDKILYDKYKDVKLEQLNKSKYITYNFKLNNFLGKNTIEVFNILELKDNNKFEKIIKVNYVNYDFYSSSKLEQKIYHYNGDYKISGSVLELEFDKDGFKNVFNNKYNYFEENNNDIYIKFYLEDLPIEVKSYSDKNIEKTDNQYFYPSKIYFDDLKK